MGFRNESASVDDEGIPTLDDIKKMAARHLRNERIRLKNELVKRRDDASCGGNSHEDEITELRTLIAAVEERIKAEGKVHPGTDAQGAA